MYAPGPSAEELQAFGLLAEDVVDDAVLEVWPENWLPLEVFAVMRTQWRVGVNGPSGLDYSPLPGILEMHGVKKKDRLDTFWAVRQMESAALNAMAE